MQNTWAGVDSLARQLVGKNLNSLILASHVISLRVSPSPANTEACEVESS